MGGMRPDPPLQQGFGVGWGGIGVLPQPQSRFPSPRQLGGEHAAPPAGPRGSGGGPGRAGGSGARWGGAESGGAETGYGFATAVGRYPAGSGRLWYLRAAPVSPGSSVPEQLGTSGNSGRLRYPMAAPHPGGPGAGQRRRKQRPQPGKRAGGPGAQHPPPRHPPSRDPTDGNGASRRDSPGGVNTGVCVCRVVHVTPLP